MAQWAGIERGLYYWFVHVTQLKDKMARAIFYSARSFNARAEMLLAAIEQANHLAPERLEFIQAALRRAWGYSSFRNSMAHGEPSMNIFELVGQPRKVSYYIAQGKSLKDASVDISMEDLETATKNFHTLVNLLIDTHPTIGNVDHQWPLEALKLLNALPSRASSKKHPESRSTFVAISRRASGEQEGVQGGATGCERSPCLKGRIFAPVPPPCPFRNSDIGCSVVQSIVARGRVDANAMSGEVG
jgi:hypothetical protein